MTDPHHITIEQSGQRVTVAAGGAMLAESGRALVLREGALPARRYIPREDVRMELLEPSSTVTTCPFKGTAQHFTAVVDGRRIEDVAWCYPDPIPSVSAIGGLLAFYDDRVDVTVEAPSEGFAPPTGG